MRRQIKYIRSGFVAGLFLVVGIILGLILSSRMDWFSLGTGDQSSESNVVKEQEPSTPTVATPPNQPFIGIVEESTPAVVNISTSRVVQDPQGFPRTPFFDDPFFRRFFGEEFFRQFEVPREQREQSLGSGVIVDPSGYIITNNHVVADSDEITVLLNDKREFKGEVVGSDPKTDIAVIKVDGMDLPAIPWGDSDRLQVGEYVLAIGNPFGLNQTVTMGIISAVGRAQVGIADYEDFIQTDAAINPGNSGGALINIEGKLIGINTAIFSRSGGYMGIGFAVPSNMARSVMDSLIETGKVIRGWLGVVIQEVDANLAQEFGLEEVKGALIGDVMSDGPAGKAGLEPGDVIVRYDDKPIDGPSNLRNFVAQTRVGKEVKIEIVRDKKSKTLSVKIGEMPAEVAQESPGSPRREEGGGLAGLDVAELSRELARRFEIEDTSRGIIILGVGQGSSAELAGLRVGDLILEINHIPIMGLKDFKRIASRVKDAETLLVLVSRQGRKVFLVIKPK